MSEPTITLFVETSKGTFLRPIRPATLLPEGIPKGYAAEDATRYAAAFWGLPDFVFRPAQRSRGSATREVGDAILVVGDVAASVQVKARQTVTPNETRERLWLDQKIHQAAKQAKGTIRNLISATDATLVNERGRRVLIKGHEKTWLLVTVIDHPGIDGYLPAGPAIVLLRRDWEFLFEQLKSTYAVLEYLRRVSAMNPVPLGDEAVRYYKLAAADAATPPADVDPRLLQLGNHKSWSAPLLPQAPAGHGDDRHHMLVRAVLEDIATVRLPDGIQQSDRIDLLAAVDATPVAYRADLGEMWLSSLRKVADSPSSSITWRFRGHIWPDRPYLLFGAASRYNALVQQAFGGYVSLRHQQQLELMPERANMTTVGVLLTPRDDGHRLWDTTVVKVEGDQEIDDDQKALLQHLWGGMGESVTQPDEEIPNPV
ncbi:MAG: hypothetical protein M3077_05730 [Candidatus Dormibacteraeota bacterium]|nr:hypothetical protein [Candidatus Dormibacteraeota bacterium]